MSEDFQKYYLYRIEPDSTSGTIVDCVVSTVPVTLEFFADRRSMQATGHYKLLLALEEADK